MGRLGSDIKSGPGEKREKSFVHSRARVQCAVIPPLSRCVDISPADTGSQNVLNPREHREETQGVRQLFPLETLSLMVERGVCFNR